MKIKIVNFIFILFIIFVHINIIANTKETTPQNDKLIIILPFKYVGTDYMTTEGDLRQLAANSVQVELAREGYNVIEDAGINLKFEKMDVELSDLNHEDLNKLNKSIGADIFITGEVLKLPVPYSDNYKLRVIYNAKETKKDETLERETITYPVGFHTQWHNLLGEMSKQFIRKLKSRNLL